MAGPTAAMGGSGAVSQIGGLTGTAPIMEQNNLTGGTSLIPEQKGTNDITGGGGHNPFSFMQSLFGGSK